MWEEIFNLAISNGLFAVLFLGLLIYQLRDSSQREKKYQDTIDRLGSALRHLESIRDDISMIMHKVDTIENSIGVSTNKDK